MKNKKGKVSRRVESGEDDYKWEMNKFFSLLETLVNQQARQKIK